MSSKRPSTTVEQCKPEHFRPRLIRGFPLRLFIFGFWLIVALGNLDSSGLLWCFLPAVVLSNLFIYVFTTRLTINGKTVELSSGFFTRAKSQIRLSDVRNIQTRQSIIGQLFGAGELAISSAAQDGVEIRIHGIRKPKQVAAEIDKLRDVRR